jgi:hypothetical protein
MVQIVQHQKDTRDHCIYLTKVTVALGQDERGTVNLFEEEG